MNSLTTAGSERTGKAPLNLSVLALAAILWLVPLDAVHRTRTLSLLHLGMLGLCAFLVLRPSGVYRSESKSLRTVAPLLAFGFVGAWHVLAQQTSYLGLAAMFVVAGAGWRAAPAIRQRVPRPLLLIGAVVGLVTLLEGVMGHSFYAKSFSTSSLWATGADVRSRGTLGMPLPTAALVATLAVVMAFAPRSWSPLKRFNTPGRVLLCAAAVVLATGSRSTLAAMIATILAVTLLGQATEQRHATRRLVLVLAYVVALGMASVALVGSMTGTRIIEGTPRVFDYRSLEGSESVTVRQGSLDLVREAERRDKCGVGCVVAGHGLHELNRIANTISSSELPTADNMFLTAWFDFGLIGLLFLAALAAGAVRRLRHSNGVTRAASAGLLFLLIQGLFFDVLYWSPLLFLCGILAGLAFAPDSIESPTTDRAAPESSGSIAVRPSPGHSEPERPGVALVTRSLRGAE